MRINIETFKENLRKYYDTEAGLRNQSVKQDWKIKVRQDFLNLLKRTAKKGGGEAGFSEGKTTEQEQKQFLLELGAGAGYDSRFFMDNGLRVVAVDLSEEMVKKCKEKEIEAYQLDFYNLSALGEKFDCIWAMNSLLHVPKADLPHILDGIDSVLKKDGLFYMGVYGGEDFEKEYVKGEVSEAPRFFSYHLKEGLEAVLKNHFQIISFEQFEASRGAAMDVVQSVVMRKKQEEA